MYFYTQVFAEQGRNVLPMSASPTLLPAINRMSTLARDLVDSVVWRRDAYWLAAEGEDHLDKRGEPMEFMTVEDQTGMYDATMFPSSYRQYCHLPGRESGYVPTGVVEEHGSALTVTVRTLRPLSPHDSEVAATPIKAVSA
jgi:DNA polymerase III alpha subunit